MSPSPAHRKASEFPGFDDELTRSAAVRFIPTNLDVAGSITKFKSCISSFDAHQKSQI
jgi:hypothetical protein